jgi:hypothetical protein
MNIEARCDKSPRNLKIFILDDASEVEGLFW